MRSVVRVVDSVLCVARVEVRGVSTVRREVYGAACCVCCGMLQCRIIRHILVALINGLGRVSWPQLDRYSDTY